MKTAVKSSSARTESSLDVRSQLFRYLLLASALFGPDVPKALAAGPSGGNSLFADHRARGTCDLVTILIMEESSAASSARTSTDRTRELGADGGGAVRSRDALPKPSVKRWTDSRRSRAARHNCMRLPCFSGS